MREVIRTGHSAATGEEVQVIWMEESPTARAPRTKVFEKYALVSHEGWKRLHDAKLTKTELTVLSYLFMHARTDDAFRMRPQQVTRDHGWDPRRTQLALARLTQVGLIDRIEHGVYGPNPEAIWVGSGVGRQQALAERHPESGENNREPSAQEEDE